MVSELTRSGEGFSAMVTVSVVLAAYQSASLVPAAVRRLRELAGPELEFILVDDGSTDGTGEAMRLASQDDDRFRVLSLDANQGLGAARRRGFLAATGTWVWNVDVDDDWPFDALAPIAENLDVDLVVLDAQRQRQDGRQELVNKEPLPARTDARGVLELLLAGRITGHLWNKVIRRSVLDGHDVFTDARIHSDLVMMLKIVPLLASVAVIRSLSYVYIERAGSNITSRRPRGEGLAAADKALDSAVKDVAPDLQGSTAVESWRAKYLVLSSLRDAVRGDYNPEERRDRFRAARRRIRLGPLMGLFGSDRRAAAQLALAAIAPGGFRILMAR